MNVSKSLALFLSMAFFSANLAAQAQKFGHLNSGNLLEALPEVKAANDELKVFGKKLEARADSMATAFESAVKIYRTEAEAGTLTALQMQQREAQLEKMRNEGTAFQQQLDALIQERRGVLLEPILKKVDDAIKAVGKEGSYTMIFDTSTGATLYALETVDVLPLVKAKMGL